uniref:C-type lectin domain-containing protein n=1 Tax=Magallana gigas TaxID=29159 RepID=A0A8W8NU06_MAGGI
MLTVCLKTITGVLIIIGSLVCGSQVMSKSQCSTPGYIRDSLLGCYKIVLYPTAVTYDEGRHACVNDGGQLFLVNSAEKGVHLIKAIRSEMITSAVIQGSRGPESSWFDEHGNPLSYLPSLIENKDDEEATKLILKFAPDNINIMFSAI